MKRLPFLTFLLVSGSAWATPVTANLFYQQDISFGVFLFKVDGVNSQLFCDQFAPNVSTEPYVATVATLADLTGTQLFRNGDLQALQKYQQVAILDLRALADPAIASDVVRANRVIVDGTGQLTPNVGALLSYAQSQNPANFNLTGFRIYDNPIAQELTGFVTPEPSTMGMVFVSGLMGICYVRRKRVS